MDKDIEAIASQEAELTASELQRQISESISAGLPSVDDDPVPPKRGRGRPKKETKKDEPADKSDGDEILPDVTGDEAAGESAGEQKKEDGDDDGGDGDVISVEDIPEDQRLEAATAIIEILSQEQKDALLDKVGEGVAAELKSLRDEKKALEDRVADIEKRSRSRIDKIISPNSFFADISTEAELDEKESKIQANLDGYDALIDSTDEIFQINGKEYTREQVRGFRNQYRHLASEAKEHRYRLREVSKYRYRFNESIAKVSEKYSWYNEEGSDKRKKYDSLIDDIDLDHLRYVAPKSAALLPNILAKYVSSEESEESARRIFKLPIKPTKPKNIRIASGGGIINKETDPASEIKTKIASGELTKDDLHQAVARSL